MPLLFQKHKFGFALIALLALFALAVAVLPWKPLLENKLKGLLESRGYSNVQMTLSDVSLTRLALTNIAFKTKNVDITIDAANANGALNAKDKKWAGQWEMKNIQISNVATPLPVLNGNGALSLQFGQSTLDGLFHDAPNTTHLTFKSNYIFSNPGKSSLIVTEFMMPWSDGKLSAQNVVIPFGNKASFDINLKIDGVSADALMQQLTGKRATATGKLSGTLPMTITPDGAIVFHEGQLQAEAPGTIAVSPDVIPGDNEQVALVREILKDFHYTSLSLYLNSGKDNQNELRLKLEGQNPQVQQGRAVKMNVTLNGDVLGFVRQNLLWLTNPKKIMEQK